MPIQDLIQLFNSARPQVGPIVLDATLQEDHSIEAEQTEDPIEEGGLVSDHRIVQPRPLRIVGVVVAAPASFLAPGGFTRPQKVWRRFRDMLNRGDVVDVITTLELYPSMSLMRVATTKSAGGGSANGLEIELVLRRVEFARIDVAQNIADVAQDLALGQAELGAQGAVAQAASELAALGVF